MAVLEALRNDEARVLADAETDDVLERDLLVASEELVDDLATAEPIDERKRLLGVESVEHVQRVISHGVISFQASLKLARRVFAPIPGARGPFLIMRRAFLLSIFA